MGSHLRPTVLDRLEEKGMIRREKSRYLGIIATTRMLPEAPAYEASLLERVRAVLENGVTPDARTATLVALLSASGTLPEFHRSIRWGNTVASRPLQFQNGNWGATAVNLAITQIAAANAAIGLAVATGVIGGNQDR
nr:GPP34 family phosphoprotein [Rhodococcus sp. Eu-32]